MKYSIVIASLAAGLTFASPVEKRWLVTEWDIATVTMTVTGAPPAATPTSAVAAANGWGGFNWGGWPGIWGGNGGSSSSAAPAVASVVPTTTAAPAPAPTTTTTQAAAAPATTAPATTAPAAAPASSPASSSSAAAPASTVAVSSNYQQGILDAHNNHRANASVPNLAWSDNMASIAQQIASSCNYAHNTQAGGGGYGQNIGAGADDSGVAAMINNQMYNDEINWYPGYGVEPDMTNFEHWGHYSQIVWKSTTSVGCYTQYCPGGLANTGGGVAPYFTVCNYSPAGNFGGQYAANVLQPGNMPTVTL